MRSNKINKDVHLILEFKNNRKKKEEDLFKRITYGFIGTTNDFISTVYMPIVKDNLF